MYLHYDIKSKKITCVPECRRAYGPYIGDFITKYDFK